MPEVKNSGKPNMCRTRGEVFVGVVCFFDIFARKEKLFVHLFLKRIILFNVLVLCYFTTPIFVVSKVVFCKVRTEPCPEYSRTEISVSSVRRPYPCPILYTHYARATISEVRVQHSFTYPALL